MHSKIIKFISVFLTYITSEYISKQLKRSGSDVNIMFPVTVIGLKYISIGNGFSSCSRLRIEAHDSYMNDEFTPEIVIGNNVSFNYDCHIACINKIIIGDNVLIASKVFITDHFHGETNYNSILLPPVTRKLYSKGPVVIESNVWIGEGVVIMPNVKIGRNSILGANSVITKNVDENSVVAGNPARVIKIIS